MSAKKLKKERSSKRINDDTIIAVDRSPSGDPSPTKESNGNQSKVLKNGFQAFINQLHEMPARFETSADFDADWDAILGIAAELEKSMLLQDVSNPETRNRFFTKGWLSFDGLRRRFTCHLEKPVDNQILIPVLLVNTHGNWRVSHNVRILLEDHPVYRAMCEPLPAAGSKEEFLSFVEGSLNCLNGTDPNCMVIGMHAQQIDMLLRDRGSGDSDKPAWLQDAKSDPLFWRLLNETFHLGGRDAIWGLYRDGSLIKSTRKGTSMGDKKTGAWTNFIRMLLNEMKSQEGKPATALRLRKHLGAGSPSDNDQPLVFTDPRCVGLPAITWPQFQDRLKQVKSEKR